MNLDEMLAPREAEAATREVCEAAEKTLPFTDRADYDDAARGFIATLPDVKITDERGQVVWSLADYAFLKSETTPPSIHPSLWRQAQVNMNNGLFKVTDNIYQVRGFDLSNMTIVEGNTGIIIIDPLISLETAKAALDLYYQHRPHRPVSAVIYTHSHVDHYGGVKGVVSAEEVKSGKLPIIAPEGFLEAAVSENVLAGNAMARRATYMYGALLPKGVYGQVDAGLGKSNSLGTVTLIPPTDIVTRTGERRVVDGVEIVFQMAHGTEAPSEMLFHFPDFRALCAAEVMTHNLHNLYTLRGAQVRDAKEWWKGINLANEMFGATSDVLFASHHWPKWGQDAIGDFLEKQRDLYKYVHDQSLRLLNKGLTMLEIAEVLELPQSLASEWYNRGYYGTVSHNAKAVYQKYLGWYDSNPANLDPLPPEASARKYVEYMGGSHAVIERARAGFEKGEYRWVAQVLNHVVFAEPDNREARALAADALEQLGYQSESGPWRNEYLMGAYELRNGIPSAGGTRTSSADTIVAMTMDLFFDYMGVRLNGPKAAGKSITLNWRFTDTGEQYVLTLQNGALTYTADKQREQADATLVLARATLDAVTTGQMTMQDALARGAIKVDGNALKLKELFDLMDDFELMFNIVTP